MAQKKPSSGTWLEWPETSMITQTVSVIFDSSSWSWCTKRQQFQKTLFYLCFRVLRTLAPWAFHELQNWPHCKIDFFRRKTLPITETSEWNSFHISLTFSVTYFFLLILPHLNGYWSYLLYFLISYSSCMPWQTHKGSFLLKRSSSCHFMKSVGALLNVYKKSSCLGTQNFL